MYFNLYDYLFDPKGYNLINTSLYSLVLFVALILIYKLFNKIRVKVNEILMTTTFPFIVFGSSLRVLKDSNLVTTILAQTPFVYLIVGSYYLVSLLISISLERKTRIPYFVTLTLFGVVPAGIALGLLDFQLNCTLLLFDLIIFYVPWGVLSYFLDVPTMNKVILATHLFDAATTTLSVEFFGYWEQHPLPRFLLQINQNLFIVSKFMAILLILNILDKKVSNENLRNYVKLIILILGMATGLRDALRFILQV